MNNPIHNPIFLTCHRLARTAGFWAQIIFVIGGSAIVIYSLWAVKRLMLTNPALLDVDLYGYYFFYLFAEGFFVLIPFLFKPSGHLVMERKDELFETNWLSPMTPTQLGIGYLFGPPVNAIYAFSLMAPIGLLICWMGGVPIWFWAATQTLMLFTALLAGVLSMACGAWGKAGFIWAVGAIFFFGWQGAAIAGSLALPNFILPVTLTMDLAFTITNTEAPFEIYRNPNMFGFSVPTVALTAVCYSGAFAWLWVIARRKFVHPSLPALNSWMTLGIFACFVIPQHGLVWHLADGRFPAEAPADARIAFTLIHVVVIFIAIGLISFNILKPKELRIDVLGRRCNSTGAIFARSGVWLAIRLAIVASAGFFTQTYQTVTGGDAAMLIPAVNIFCAIVIYALILEIAAGFFAKPMLKLGRIVVFLLYFGPFVFLMGVANDPASLNLVAYSLLYPGAFEIATAGQQLPFVPRTGTPTIVHVVIMVLLLIVWCFTWANWREKQLAKQLQNRELPSQPENSEGQSL